MKKLIRLSFLLATFFRFTDSFGQENKFAIGAEVGPNYTFLRGTEFYNDGEAAVRLFSGLSFQCNFDNVFSLHTGIAHEQKGDVKKIQMTDPNGVPLGESKVDLIYSYLTVPVLVRATFGEKIKCFVNFGPYVGYALDHVSKGENPTQPDRETDYSASFKKFDYGLSGGAGVIYPVDTNLDLSLELRNNLGLNNIANFTVYQGDAIKTNTLNFLVGLTYKISNDPDAGN